MTVLRLKTSVLFSGLVLFVLFSIVSSQFTGFEFADIGTPYNFTCGVYDSSKNYTYKFSNSRGTITPDGRIKQYRNILMIKKLDFTDSALYTCYIYGSNGKEIRKIVLGILSVNRVIKKVFKIFPDEYSIVDEGESFEFRCEYGGGSTEMQWVRRRRINGTDINDHLPRELITVLTTSQKSAEVYSIKKVTPEDSGAYRCDVNVNGKLQSSKARVLQVRLRPKTAPAFGDVKTTFTVNRRHDVRIALNVTGNPVPDIHCYHEDHLIISCAGKTIESIDVANDPTKPACEQDNYVITGHHELMIKSATFAGNDGMYRCEANNSVATAVASFRVNVTGFHRPTVSMSKLGSSHRFTCPAAHPQMYKYKFHHFGFFGLRKLIANDVNTKQSGNVLIKSNLRFIDSGFYYCSVYDQDDKVIEEHLLIEILSVWPVIKF